MSHPHPLQPTDPWYQPPPGYASHPPGTILRSRPAPDVSPSLFANCSAIHQLLFATTHGPSREPSWAVTTLLLPSAPSSPPRPPPALLSYQIPYNTVDPRGSPSLLLPNLTVSGWSYLVPHLENGLSRGWAINFPDHEGPRAAFGDGWVEGPATLDSIRAVLGADVARAWDPGHAARVCMWGFSGGAIASGWAAQLQPSYAPDLGGRLLGTALGALPPTPEFIKGLGGGRWAGLIPLILLGVLMGAPAAYQAMVGDLRPEVRERFLAAWEYDVVAAFAAFAGEDVWGYFRRGEGIMDVPEAQAAFARNRMGFHGVPGVPLYIYKSIVDEVTPVKDTDEVVERWRVLGANILYERNTVGGHAQESAVGLPRAFEFMNALFNGTYEHEGVTIRNVTLPSQ